MANKTLSVRKSVLRDMAYYAIRDQKALLDALMPNGQVNSDNFAAVTSAKKRIADYMNLLKKCNEEV